MNHQHDEEHPPQLSQMSFVNAKDWDDPAFNESLLVNRPQFGQSISVNLNSSAVHMPLQVYEGCELEAFFSVFTLFTQNYMNL